MPIPVAGRLTTNWQRSGLTNWDTKLIEIQWYGQRKAYNFVSFAAVHVIQPVIMTSQQFCAPQTRTQCDRLIRLCLSSSVVRFNVIRQRSAAHADTMMSTKACISCSCIREMRKIALSSNDQLVAITEYWHGHICIGCFRKGYPFYCFKLTSASAPVGQTPPSANETQ